jgi:hypothetical protein
VLLGAMEFAETRLPCGKTVIQSRHMPVQVDASEVAS